MKVTLAILFFLLSVMDVKADYRPLYLYEMILGAEKIVYGEVTSIDSLTYTLQIEKNLTGQESEIVIQRFRNWSCAQRWAEYQVGQKLFLFLKSFKGEMRAMSAGNEGELPIYKGSVFINSLSLDIPPPPKQDGDKVEASNIDYFEMQHHTIYGRDYFGHRSDLKLFSETVHRIRSCFEIEYSEYNKINKVNITCDENQLRNELEISSILNWTHKKLKKKHE